jgi:uncharacterized protein YqcC (DUF446 family)
MRHSTAHVRTASAIQPSAKLSSDAVMGQHHGMTDDPRRSMLAPHVDALEAELRRLGWWQAGPATREMLAFERAFAMDTMAFSQWLQFVFLPAARDMLAGTRALPPSSSLAPHAVREFDGVDEASELEAILRRIDDAVNGR